MAKPKNMSDYLIAATVIGCSVLLLTVMTIALSGWESPGGHLIKVDMPTVTGLRKDSQVRYAGAHVGKVVDIRPLDWKDRQDPKYAIRITAKINQPMPALKTDSVASINSDSILAEKFLDLSPGSKEAADLPPDQALLCRDVASFDDLSRAGMQSLDQLNDILQKLQKDGDLSTKVSSLVSNASTLAKNADVLIKQLNSVMEAHRGELDQRLDDLSVIIQNLKVVSTYSKTLSGTLARKPWRIVWGNQPPELPSEEEIMKSNKPILTPVPKD